MGNFSYRLSIGAAAALLAACGGLRPSTPLGMAQGDMQPPIGAPAAIPKALGLAARTNSSTFKLVYSFGQRPDGNNPEASLIDVDGTLYGTTTTGGSYSNTCRYYGNGCGTVFTITPSGTEKVLHNFGYGADGGSPFAPLIEVKGKLYGTTFEGGAHPSCSYAYTGCGTVYSITTGGTEKVLHSFPGGSGVDGRQPDAPLVDVKGALYGTTYAGGSNFCPGYPQQGCGTVFTITTAGTEKVLHSFGARHDGNSPGNGLIDVNDTLYGTTPFGGADNNQCRTGCGTVFSITSRGRERVLYRFGPSPDGIHPRASLIDVGGTLYGTTTTGGSYLCSSNGCGTVFSITPSGTEKVLHRFGQGTDGATPAASLVAVKGTLYGTTAKGGSSSCSCGTIFSITKSGTEKVLYSFSGPDGANPVASLIDVNGTLYGTTRYGGANDEGTVFALTL